MIKREREKGKKKLLIAVAAAAVLVCLAVITIVVISNDPQRKIEKQLALGDRYLSELDYDKAVAAYKAVIEIDPKNTDAYLGLAKAYTGMGDHAAAADILAEGYEQTKDDALLEQLTDTYLVWAEAVMEPDTQEAVIKAMEILQTGYDRIKVERLLIRIRQLEEEAAYVEAEGILYEFTSEMIPADIWEAEGLSLQTPGYYIVFENDVEAVSDGKSITVREARVDRWGGDIEEYEGVKRIYRGKIEINKDKMDGLIAEGEYRYDPYDYLFVPEGLPAGESSESEAEDAELDEEAVLRTAGDNGWRAAYHDKTQTISLDEFIMEYSSGKTMKIPFRQDAAILYDLAFINEDTVPELVCSVDMGDYTYYINLYTFHAGEVIKLGTTMYRSTVAPSYVPFKNRISLGGGVSGMGTAVSTSVGVMNEAGDGIDAVEISSYRYDPDKYADWGEAEAANDMAPEGVWYSYIWDAENKSRIPITQEEKERRFSTEGGKELLGKYTAEELSQK